MLFCGRTKVKIDGFDSSLPLYETLAGMYLQLSGSALVNCERLRSIFPCRSVWTLQSTSALESVCVNGRYGGWVGR